jgi:hypothetical protein
MRPYMDLSLTYIYKNQIDIQSLIDIQSSNPCPISTSQTSVAQIDVLFSNSQIYGRVLLFQIDVSDITDV